MGALKTAADSAFRDYNTDGVSGSGARNVPKSEVRALFTSLDGLIEAGQLSGFRNKLINGSFDIWQRGASGSTTGGYMADRWRFNAGTSWQRSTDVPSGQGFTYSLEFAHSSAAFAHIGQRIEAANAIQLAGRRVRFSFWAKAAVGTSALYAEIYTANAADNFSAVTYVGSPFTQSAPSSSWTYYSGEVTLPAGAANGVELRIIRNDLSVHTTRITGAQLEVVDANVGRATPFEFLPTGLVLSLCQRYFERINAPSAYTGAFGVGYCTSTTAARVVVPFKTPKRAAPTVSVNSVTGFALLVGSNIATTNVQTLSGQSDQLSLTITVASGLTAGQGCLLSDNAAAAYIDINAEL